MYLKKDMYEIRLESIGGFGANLTGKLLGEIGAKHMGVETQSFASYGSEKRGSPVKAYIRYSNSEIRLNEPVREPDMLAIFVMSLAGKEDLMAGVDENTDVVVNSHEEHDKVRDRLRMHKGRLWVVDALDIALECKSRLNMVMMGACARASGFIPLEFAEEVVKEVLGSKYPEKTTANLMALKMGYSRAVCKEYTDDKYPYEKYKEPQRVKGWKTGEIGGINPEFGNSVTNSLVGCREGYVPHFIREKCIDCGLCDSTCPDMVFQFENGVNKGMDLYHCKGCMRCVEICPTHALVEVEEDKYDDNIGCIDLINKEFLFTDIGENSWVDSESTNNQEV